MLIFIRRAPVPVELQHVSVPYTPLFCTDSCALYESRPGCVSADVFPSFASPEESFRKLLITSSHSLPKKYSHSTGRNCTVHYSGCSLARSGCVNFYFYFILQSSIREISGEMC